MCGDVVEILTGRHQNSYLLLGNCLAAEKQILHWFYINLEGSIWAYNYSLPMCLDFLHELLNQFSWLVGRHLREETCWQSVADLGSFSLKLAGNIKAAGRRFQMLYYVMQVFVILSLWHSIWGGFRWTYGENTSHAWYGVTDHFWTSEIWQWRRMQIHYRP